MSKSTEQVEVQRCDACLTATHCDACLNCKVEHCWECRKKLGREYPHGVYASGSGDGYFCSACDVPLTRSMSDPLHNAYYEIASLRADAEAHHLRFTQRKDAAEAKLKALLDGVTAR